jgi:hypothetical protein
MPLAIQALEAYRFTANIAGVPVDIRFADLPEASQLFQVEYGAKQYLQDGAAVSKKENEGKDDERLRTPEEIAALKIEGVNERVANLQAGEFTRRSSAVKLTPEQRHRNDVIMDGLKKFADSIGKKLPARTGKKADPEKLDAQMAAWYKKNQAEIDKEVARRMKAAEKPIVVEPDSELAELFA